MPLAFFPDPLTDNVLFALRLRGQGTESFGVQLLNGHAPEGIEGLDWIHLAAKNHDVHIHALGRVFQFFFGFDLRLPVGTPLPDVDRLGPVAHPEEGFVVTMGVE